MRDMPSVTQERTKWSQWFLWWRTDPDEMRLQIDFYATLGVLHSARGFGLVVAFTIGLGQLMLGLYCVTQMDGHIRDVMTVPAGVGIVGLTAFLLVAGTLLFPLGWLVYRGNQAAMGAVMALWTVAVVLFNGFEWGLSSLRQESVELVLSLVAWPMCLHAFYTAQCVERDRVRTA